MALRRPMKARKSAWHGLTTTCVCSRRRDTMATLDNDRAGAAPWLLSAPALLLFGSLLLVPLLLTLVLSFHVFSDSQGTLATYTLRNYLEVLTDPYYGAIFARTPGMAFALTFLCLRVGVRE